MALAKYYEDNQEIYNERMRDSNFYVDTSTVIPKTEHQQVKKSVSYSKIILEHRICPCCGEEFVISLGEAVFFFKNDLHLPKKCKTCRTTARASTKIPCRKTQRL